MGKVIDAPPQLPSLNQARVEEPILAGTHQQIINTSNALFANQYHLIPGQAVWSSTPIVESNSPTYTQVGSGGSNRWALREWAGIARQDWRLITAGSDELHLELLVYAEDASLRLRIGADTLIVAATAAGWYRAIYTTSSPPANALLTLEIQRTTTLARLWAWEVRERLLLPADTALLP